MKFRSSVQPTNSQVKERTLNAIKIDHMQLSNTAIKAPMQPFMEYMMDVISEALKSTTYEDNTITIQNKNEGLKFTIKKIEDETCVGDHYTVKLYNGNEIRFSGNVMNAGNFDKNQWYFTEKYEDVVSVSDINQFIEATAMLRAKMFTEKADSVAKLMSWIIYCTNPNKGHTFDKSTYITRQDHDGVIDLELIMGDVHVAEYTLCVENDNVPEVIREQNNHDVPPAVTMNLGNTVKDTVCNKFQNTEIKRIKASQERFNASHAGIRYNERAKLNDLFKNYA